jgi:acyl carrier protein
MQRAEVLELVITSLSSALAENGHVSTEPLTESTPLIGRSSALDSLGLVQLLVEVEQRLEQEQDLSITVADDRAMSQRNSPFRTVGTLTDYVWMLLEEQRSYVRP